MTPEEFLKNLLSQKNPKLGPLESELKTSPATSVSMTTGESKAFCHIYSRRAAIDKGTGGGTHGYDDLLAILGSLEGETVRILGVNTKNLSFLIFADDQGERILGMLWG